mmetsp:Transcript_15217/g.42063  ORF Transcript_15217/g.42063 Transcript_15217/m.42063 type:complete len:293 (+) Transcript_15217:378-1256(+)
MDWCGSSYVRMVRTLQPSELHAEDAEWGALILADWAFAEIVSATTAANLMTAWSQDAIHLLLAAQDALDIISAVGVIEHGATWQGISLQLQSRKMIWKSEQEVVEYEERTRRANKISLSTSKMTHSLMPRTINRYSAESISRRTDVRIKVTKESSAARAMLLWTHRVFDARAHGGLAHIDAFVCRAGFLIVRDEVKSKSCLHEKLQSLRREVGILRIQHAQVLFDEVAEDIDLWLPCHGQVDERAVGGGLHGLQRVGANVPTHGVWALQCFDQPLDDLEVAAHHLKQNRAES